MTTINVTDCPAPAPATPPETGAFTVAASFAAGPDGAFGPFSTRAAAEKCASNLALRADVRRVTIAPPPTA